MAKKVKLTDEDLFAQIAKTTGGGILSDVESIGYFIDTGNLAFNYVCSGKFIDGGIPGCRITEFYGPEASGKSLVASNVLYGCQKLGGIPVILDCENATNGEFMEKTSHLNLKKVIRQTPMTLERAFRKIHTMTKEIRKHFPTEPIVFVYDSISVSPCERELRETDLPDEYKPSDWKRIVGANCQPGERAKVCSSEFRKLTSVLTEQNATVLILNQTREKIGVMFGNPETTGGGGNALKFYASLRVRTGQKKKIETAKGSFAGVGMQAKNIKNRCFRPFAVAEEIRVYFDSGIDPVSGLLGLLVQEGRVELESEGNYCVVPDFTEDGKKYKFKAKEKENRVPPQVLIDCPKVINAASGQEVEGYLSSFKTAMEATESGKFSEKELPKGLEAFEENDGEE